MSSLDIGIDLGTTKTIIHKEDEGVILSEPSIVAIDTNDDTIIAVGKAALAMFERTPPNINVVYPLNDGVISNHILTEVLIKEFLKRACSNYLVKHRVIICTPSSITNVEKRTLVEVVVNSGGRKVYLIEEPIAAAIGCNIDISEASGNLIVDIGGGTTDIAVLSLMGVVVSHSIKYAGNKVDDEIVKLFSTKYKMSIGRKMAEMVKIQVGNLFNPSSEVTAQVKGRNLLTGLPYMITVNEHDIYEALMPFGETIVGSIKFVLERTPPELIGDIYMHGIVLTGGGALIKGLPELISQCTNVKVVVADSPIECVARGTSGAFKYIGMMESGFSSESTHH